MRHLASLATIVLCSTAHAALAPLRPPAVPLIVHDPYLSIWSTDNKLTDSYSRHWTGATQAVCVLARVDGKAYRLMGPTPADVPPMGQKSVLVTPTQTIYRFQAPSVAVSLTFLTPALPDEPLVMARPASYIRWDVRSTDRKVHKVSLFLHVSPELAVDNPRQVVRWETVRSGSRNVVRLGTVEQPVLKRAGDAIRIDWGNVYLEASGASAGRMLVSPADTARVEFAAGKRIAPMSDNTPRAAEDGWPSLVWTLDVPRVGAAVVSRHVVLAYDDTYSIQLMGKNLRGYWRKALPSADALLVAAEKDYGRLTAKCQTFDSALTADLAKMGGEEYARLAVLSYRQSLAACKLAVDGAGRMLMFPKENSSNGCISTVDVIYPGAPLLLFVSPALLKAQMTPVLEYSATARWRWPFAPHDLGTYPLANGQVYGGGERTEDNQMPVEETGNMLLLMAAIAKVDGNAAYAKPFWPTLSKWANYLREKGLDPSNQLCTDDFAGHLAHNTNLSVKAILALGGYAQMANMLGKKAEAAEYSASARAMAKQWVEMADAGDHYRVAFDKPDSWSQKYNLAWDRILGLGIFPKSVARKELAFYRTQMNPYGVPLDNRKAYTKLDWQAWIATLEERPADMRAFLNPLYKMANETPDRVPLTDWYWTTDGRKSGFQARSVVGGVYMPMLTDATLWRKWAKPGQ